MEKPEAYFTSLMKAFWCIPLHRWPNFPQSSVLVLALWQRAPIRLLSQQIPAAPQKLVPKVFQSFARGKREAATCCCLGICVMQAGINYVHTSKMHRPRVWSILALNPPGSAKACFRATSREHPSERGIDCAELSNAELVEWAWSRVW